LEQLYFRFLEVFKNPDIYNFLKVSNVNIKIDPNTKRIIMAIQRDGVIPILFFRSSIIEKSRI